MFLTHPLSFYYHYQFQSYYLHEFFKTKEDLFPIDSFSFMNPDTLNLLLLLLYELPRCELLIMYFHLYFLGLIQLSEISHIIFQIFLSKLPLILCSTIHALNYYLFFTLNFSIAIQSIVFSI